MEFGWINIFGAVIIAIMLLPNIIYAKRFSDEKRRYMLNGKLVTMIEQVGRYGSMLLMILPLGVWKFGFPNVFALMLYLLGNAALISAYIIIWVFYFKKRTFSKAAALAVIPAVIFLLSGLTLHHLLLVIFAAVFGAAHIYITYKNNAD